MSYINYGDYLSSRRCYYPPRPPCPTPTTITVNCGGDSGGGTGGSIGPTGATGAPGSNSGFTGYTGYTGYTGPTGIRGYTGYTGYTGCTGPPGGVISISGTGPISINPLSGVGNITISYNTYYIALYYYAAGGDFSAAANPSGPSLNSSLLNSGSPNNIFYSSNLPPSFSITNPTANTVTLTNSYITSAGNVITSYSGAIGGSQPNLTNNLSYLLYPQFTTTLIASSSTVAAPNQQNGSFIYTANSTFATNKWVMSTSGSPPSISLPCSLNNGGISSGGSYGVPLNYVGIYSGVTVLPLAILYVSFDSRIC